MWIEINPDLVEYISIADIGALRSQIKLILDNIQIDLKICFPMI